MTPFVLLHGAFHGGWCWARVAPLLRAAGHVVFMPTQTGLGERAHLLHKAITLSTFVADVVAVLEAEELTEVVLVGHSFGGTVISGVAELVPERLRHLVYLDATVPVSGRTPLDLGTAASTEERRRLGAESGGVSVAAPDPGVFGVPPGPDAEWVGRRLTPQPFGAFDSALVLQEPPGNGVPCTYVACTDPVYEGLGWARERARVLGWPMRTLATGHDAMVTAPRDTADLLMEFAQ